MKITYKGDYAFKALLELSHHYGKNTVVSLAELSKSYDIPAQYLEHIMLVLKRAGYVDSRRGAGGGFFLIQSPEEISLGEIIRLLEGPIEPFTENHPNDTTINSKISQAIFAEIWADVARAISSVVDGVTFAHMMRRSRELKEKNTGYMYQI